VSLDLYEPQINERLSALPAVANTEPGVFEGFWRGTGLGVMRSLAQTARAIDLMGAVGPIIGDWSTGGTTLQDKYFREHEEVWQGAVDYWTPKPGEVGVAAEVVGQLAGLLPQVIVSPALAVGATQLSYAEELSRKGVSPEKAQAVGAIQAVTLGTGIWAPILGNNLWQRMLIGGAGFNVVQGTVARGASSVVLEGTKAGEEFKAFDATALTLDVLLGLAFGGIAHLSPQMRAQGKEAWERIGAWAEKLTPSEKAAIATLRTAQHLNEDSLPGVPASAGDVDAHVARMRQALDQTIRGEPVEVRSRG